MYVDRVGTMKVLKLWIYQKQRVVDYTRCFVYIAKNGTREELNLRDLFHMKHLIHH